MPAKVLHWKSKNTKDKFEGAGTDMAVLVSISDFYLPKPIPSTQLCDRRGHAPKDSTVPHYVDCFVPMVDNAVVGGE